MAYHNPQLAEPDFANVAVLHSYWQLAVDPSDSPNVAIPAGLTPRDLIGYGEDATEKGANYMLSARFEFIARVMQSVYHAALLCTPSSYVKDTETLFQTAYLGEPKVFAAVPMSRYRDFDHTWACFLGNVAAQWDFLRIACAVLLSAIVLPLTLSHDKIASGFGILAYTWALVGSVTSHIYQRHFYNLRDHDAGMRWTEHAEKEDSATVFDIHALLALPKASFIWSIICLSIFFTLRLWSLTIGGTLMCLNTEPSARSLADATQLPECRTVPFISTAAVVIIILHAAFVTRKFLAVGKITCNEAYN